MRLHLFIAVLAGAAWSCGSAGSVPGSPSPSGSPLPGASPSVAPPVTRAFAYAAFGGDGRGGIAAYRVNLDTGALDALATTPLEGPGGLAADPSGRFLYAVDNGDGRFPAQASVLAYRIGGSGTLEEVGRLRAPEGWSKAARLLGASDRFVYVLVNDSSTAYAVAIVVYRIGDRGQLTEVGYSGAGVSCCLQFFSLDATGQSVFMDSGGRNRVMAYRTNTDGTLARSGEAPAADSPTAGGMHSSGRWLVAGGGSAGTAYLASYAAGTATLQGPVVSLATGYTAHTVAADPRGRFMFAGSFDDVFSYRLDAETGALVEAPWSTPFREPKALAADPNGRFLYVGGYYELAIYAIDPEHGALADTGLSTRPGPDVSAIAIVPAR